MIKSIETPTETPQTLAVHRDTPKIISEYDQEIPESQTADKPMTSRGRATQHSRDAKNTN